MSRIDLVKRPTDVPDDLSEEEAVAAKALFEFACPGEDDPVFKQTKLGFAIVAHNPELALQLGKMSKFFVMELKWAQRRDLRELAVQSLNYALNCEYSFRCHYDVAIAEGITAEQQAAIPYWASSSLFDEEQRLVIEYALATVDGDIPDELLERVKAQFGERGTVEFTAAVAWWAFWAMIINAAKPDLDND